MEHKKLNVENIKIFLRKQMNREDFCDDIALFWHGYLFALLEFGVIEGDNELYTLLPQVGTKERYDFALGEASDIDVY